MNCTATGSGFVDEDRGDGCDHYIHIQQSYEGDGEIKGEAENNSNIFYTLNTEGSTGVTFTANKELPAMEHTKIQVTPDVGMGLPSEFPIRVNDATYMVRPFGNSEGGISVTYKDGVYTITVPAYILMPNAKDDGDNVIYMNVQATRAYIVSEGTMEHIPYTYFNPVAPIDADCNIHFYVESKYRLAEVSVTINGTTFAQAQFAENGIACTCDESFNSCTLVISDETLVKMAVSGRQNTIVFSARAVPMPKYVVQSRNIVGATLRPHADVDPERDCTDIVLTVNDETPVVEYITVTVNGVPYQLKAPGNSGVHVKASGHTYTITVPSSVMMEHLKETDNMITIDAYARAPITTITHTSAAPSAKETYTENWVVKYTDKDPGYNEDGSYSTFIEIEDGFILGRNNPIHVEVKCGGVIYSVNLSGEASTGDFSFDPETGELRISKEFLEMFPEMDINIDVAVREVLRQISLTTATAIENLTVSNTWADIDEEEAYLITLTTTGGKDNQRVKGIKVTVSDGNGHAEDDTITRTNSMDGYPHMKIFWLEDRKEQIIFRGDKLIDLLSEWNKTPTKWTTGDLTITFNEITYEDRPNAPESAAFVMDAPEPVRYHATGRVVRLSDPPPQPTPVEPAEPETPQTIPVAFDLTNLSHRAIGSSANPGEDYQVAFFHEAGFTLPETVTVTIDGTAYQVYTDGQEHREGENLPPMPTFDSEEDILTIPGMLLTEDTQSVSIAASGMPESPVGEEKTEPPADANDSGEKTESPTDDDSSRGEAEQPADGDNTSEGTEPLADGNNTSEETEAPV